MQVDVLRTKQGRSQVERRVVLVPQDAEGTAESIQDREPPQNQAPLCRRCLQVRGQFEGWCWSTLNKQSPVQQQCPNFHRELPVEIRTVSKR